MNLLSIKHWQVECLTKMKLSLTSIWYLEQYIKGNKPEGKEVATLKSRFFIDDKNEISAIGENFYLAWVRMEEPAQKPKKVKREKPTGLYAEEWDAFWNQWPQMRTFEYMGKPFILNKPFKANEQVCRDKYTKAIQSGEITTERMHHAAKVAIISVMIESYRRGSNQMEFMNGMQPWLNQKQYLNWMNIEMPTSCKSNTEPQMVGI